MINREIYDAALALLAEKQDELSADYEERAPHILAAFLCECREALGLHGGVQSNEDASVLADLDGTFPFSDRFFSAGVYYMAATLVETENDELCDRLFSHYANAMSCISRGMGEVMETRDVYGFHCCE